MQWQRISDLPVRAWDLSPLKNSWKCGRDAERTERHPEDGNHLSGEALQKFWRCTGTHRKFHPFLQWAATALQHRHESTLSGTWGNWSSATSLEARQRTLPGAVCPQPLGFPRVFFIVWSKSTFSVRSQPIQTESQLNPYKVNFHRKGVNHSRKTSQLML